MSRHISSITGMVRRPRMMPPMPERVGDRLAQAEALRDLEVGHRARLVAADLDHVDRVVGAVERGAAIGRLRTISAAARRACRRRRATSSDVSRRSASMSNEADLRIGELLVSRGCRRAGCGRTPCCRHPMNVILAMRWLFLDAAQRGSNCCAIPDRIGTWRDQERLSRCAGSTHPASGSAELAFR